MGRIEIGNFKMSWGKSAVGETYDLKGTHALETIFGSYDNFSSEPVTERRALGLSAVYTSLNVLSRTMASLPINVMRETPTDGGMRKDVLTDHPAYDLIAHQPNSWMSSAQMMLTSTIHAHGWGNSVIGIDRDGFGRPIRLELIEQGDFSFTKVDGEVFYNIRGMTVAARDVLHFRWFTLDGLCGLSPITLNRITMGKAFKQERYSQIAIGIKPPGYLSNPTPVNPTTRAQAADNWKTAMKSGDTPVLVGDWKYNPLMIAPGDAEYLGTAQLTERQIYAIYQIPPAFAQMYERMTWNNAEQADLIYAKHTIAPIVRVMEQECNMKLFTEGEKKNTFVKFNMNGLLRADTKTRAEYYNVMRNIAGINGNEIRDKEDMNPYEGGDIFTIQGANVPIDQLREFYASKLAPQQPQQPTVQKNGNYVHIN